MIFLSFWMFNYDQLCIMYDISYFLNVFESSPYCWHAIPNTRVPHGPSERHNHFRNRPRLLQEVPRRSLPHAAQHHQERTPSAIFQGLWIKPFAVQHPGLSFGIMEYGRHTQNSQVWTSSNTRIIWNSKTWTATGLQTLLTDMCVFVPANGVDPPKKKQ